MRERSAPQPRATATIRTPARALAADPPLILADEPTASLDAETGFEAMNLLKRLCRESGKTVLVVTHDSRIVPLADRVLLLADGRIVGQSAAAAAQRDGNICDGSIEERPLPQFTRPAAAVGVVACGG